MNICKFCGSMQLVNHFGLGDTICQDCTFWQNADYPIINFRGHRYYVGNMNCDTNTVLLARVHWRGQLKRRGIVARVIEAPLRDLPDHIQKLLA